MKRVILFAAIFCVTAAGGICPGGNEWQRRIGAKEFTKRSGEPKVGRNDHTRRGTFGNGGEGLDREGVQGACGNSRIQKVAVEGVIVRSCKMEGCWMEMAERQGGRSVRVHVRRSCIFYSFECGRYEGEGRGCFQDENAEQRSTSITLIKDDGAKFENRNADGTVTEVSFDATGVELTKVK
jgi:hypothetical protein